MRQAHLPGMTVDRNPVRRSSSDPLDRVIGMTRPIRIRDADAPRGWMFFVGLQSPTIPQAIHSPHWARAGLRHVRSLLAAAPTAVPWRMSNQDYLAAFDPVRQTALQGKARLESPWDPTLADIMRTYDAAVFEESLISFLMEDLACGCPAPNSNGDANS